MSTLVLQNNRAFLKALSAFELVRGLSESELETLEILSNEENKKLLERSLEESRNNKVAPVESIL